VGIVAVSDTTLRKAIIPSFMSECVITSEEVSGFLDSCPQDIIDIVTSIIKNRVKYLFIVFPSCATFCAIVSIFMDVSHIITLYMNIYENLQVKNGLVLAKEREDNKYMPVGR